MTQPSQDDRAALQDVKQLGLWAGIASLGYVFWVVGGMEMVERLAYFGVRSVSMLYVTDAKSRGGLGLTPADLGNIFLVWALVQSLVPAFIGGLSDRVGYKETIFMSTVVKIAGYLTMAFFPTHLGFTVGAMVLAFGTGIFKPGVQGTLVKTTNRQNSSLAWGIFYQTVNIGGFLGPILAAWMRQMAWQNVFFACAAIISINFILILIYKEPKKEERLERKRKIEAGEIEQRSLWRESLAELAKPHTLWFLIIMSGFWFMLNALWDVGPLYIRDWVDTTTIVQTLFGPDGAQSAFWIRTFSMTDDGQTILPEGIVNINAFMIMLTCFLVAQVSGKLKAINSIILGTFLAGASFVLMGWTIAAWGIVAAIVIFSMGEMFSSPKFLEYMGNIAPDDKKAMYLGFSQLSLTVGWVLESKVGATLYGMFADKDTLSRTALGDRGMDPATIDAIPTGEAFQALVDALGKTPGEATLMLYQGNDIGIVWYVMASVAFVTCVALYFYGRWIWRLARATAPGQAPPEART